MWQSFRVLTLVVVTFGLAPHGTVLAATDQQVFQKLIDRVAPEVSFSKFKPKYACACLTSNPPIAGYLENDGTGKIQCVLPTFDGNGKIFAIGPCVGQFEFLGR